MEEGLIMMPIDSNQQTVQAVTIMRRMITPVTAALTTNSVETTVPTPQ